MNPRLIAFTLAIALTFGSLALFNTAPQVIASASAASLDQSAPDVKTDGASSSSREHPTLLPTVYVTARVRDYQGKNPAP